MDTWFLAPALALLAGLAALAPLGVQVLARGVVFIDLAVAQAAAAAGLAAEIRRPRAICAARVLGGRSRKSYAGASCVAPCVASVRKQRARWPLSKATTSGRVCRQTSAAKGQRSAKAQPAGKALRSGGAPPMVCSRAPLASAPCARLLSKARV